MMRLKVLLTHLQVGEGSILLVSKDTTIHSEVLHAQLDRGKITVTHFPKFRSGDTVLDAIQGIHKCLETKRKPSAHRTEEASRWLKFTLQLLLNSQRKHQPVTWPTAYMS